MPEERYWRKLEANLSVRLHKIGKGSILWFLAWSTFGFSLLFTHELLAFLGLLLCLAIAILGAWPMAYGPGYESPKEWFKTRKLRGNDGHVLDPKELEETSEGEAQNAKPKRFNWPFKIILSSFPVPGPERSDLGTLWYKDRDCDSSVVITDGWRDANRDGNDRFGYESAMSMALLECALMYKESVGFTMGLMSRPLNIERMREVAKRRLHPKVLEALGRVQGTPTNVYERQALDFQELDVLQRLHARDVFPFFSLNVPRPITWPRDKDGNTENKRLNAQQIRNAPIVRMTEVLEDNLLRQGAINPHALSMRELGTLVRTGWDITTIHKMHREIVDGTFDSTSSDIWPTAKVRLLRDANGLPYLALDGTVHRVWRVFNYDGQPVFPSQFKKLYMAGDIGMANETGLTVTMSGDTFFTRDEERSLGRFVTIQKGIRDFRFGDDYAMTPTQMEDNEALELRMNNLHNGGKQGIYYNTLITTSAINIETLMEADDVVDKHARATGAYIKAIKPESRIVRGFSTGVFAAANM